MKIATVVGERPQFIKANILSRVLRSFHKELLIHTGKHYDHNMSDIFFQELSIPTPDYNLGICGTGHGKVTGAMLGALEDIFLNIKPEMVLVYGDTNSTLAGALAAVKLNIPICHIEAGVRGHTLSSPEEINRVLTDRISTLLMCCTETAVTELAQEGRTENVFLTGDLMYDALVFYQEQLDKVDIKLVDLAGDYAPMPSSSYYLLTCHRQENSNSDEPLFEILKAMGQLDYPTIYPVHPRNEARAKSLLAKLDNKNILLVKPVGYLTSLRLIRDAKKVVTDSGGVQREAWFFNRQCITIMDKAVWPETLIGNINQMSSANASEILAKLQVTPNFLNKGLPFGDGKAAEKILGVLSSYAKDRGCG